MGFGSMIFGAVLLAIAIVTGFCVSGS